MVLNFAKVSVNRGNASLCRFLDLAVPKAGGLVLGRHRMSSRVRHRLLLRRLGNFLFNGVSFLLQLVDPLFHLVY